MEIIDSEVRDRIEKLIHVEGLSQKEFAVKVGVNSTNLNQVILGKRPVQRNLPSKIVAAFPDVRIDWLLYGDGEMYKGDQSLADAEALNRHMSELPTRPRLPKKMSEAYIEQYYKGKKRILCQEKPIVTQFAEYDFSLILKNNRMSPKYERGDEIFFKKATFPEWGNDFLLDTDDGPKFKRIFPHTNEKGEECVRCASYNKEEFPDFVINMKNVHGFYRCVGVLRIL